MSWLGGLLGAVGGFVTGGPVGAVAGAIGGFSGGGGHTTPSPSPIARPGGAGLVPTTFGTTVIPQQYPSSGPGGTVMTAGGPRLPRPLKKPTRNVAGGRTTTVRKKPHMNVGNARAAMHAIHRIRGVRRMLHHIEKHLPRVRHRQEPAPRRGR